MREILLKHRKKLILGGCLLLVLITGCVIGYNVVKGERERSLEAASMAAEQDNRLNFWGEVIYEKAYDISIDFPATVTGVKVKEGDRVALGQVLVTLDMSEYRGTVDKLMRQLEAGEAGLLDIVQDTAALEADIAKIQKDISTKTEELNKRTNADLVMLHTALNLAKKEVENAKRDLKQNQALYDKGAVSPITLDQYKDILAQKEKALSDVESNIRKTEDALRTELDQLNIALKSKKAQLEQIRNSNSANTVKQNSSVEISRIDLELMKNKSLKEYINGNDIISCVNNGIVQDLAVINGTRLGVQNTPVKVLRLIDADSIVVSAEVEEEFINSIALGEAVEIVPVSDSSVVIPGKIIQIANVAVEKDGKRIVKVQIKPEASSEKLKPGYSVDVYLQNSQ